MGVFGGSLQSRERDQPLRFITEEHGFTHKKFFQKLLGFNLVTGAFFDFETQT